MRLKARIGGRCEVCEVDLIDHAYTIVVTNHAIVTQAGEPGIRDAHEVTRTICPECYGSVYRAIEKS